LDFFRGEHCFAIVRNAGDLHLAPVEFPAMFLRQFLSERKACSAAFQTESALPLCSGGTVEFWMLWINVRQAEAKS
jgi:hypothetical protein